MTLITISVGSWLMMVVGLMVSVTLNVTIVCGLLMKKFPDFFFEEDDEKECEK